MYIARTEDKKLIDINKAEIRGRYYCTCCNQSLVVKLDKTNCYFVHENSDNCDTYIKDTSVWRRKCLAKFRHTDLEIPIEHLGEKHIADVVIKNTVILFHHDKVEMNEFIARTQFFVAAGYNVIWILDRREAFSYKYDLKIKRNKAIYKYKPILDYPYSSESLSFENVKVFFYIADDFFAVLRQVKEVAYSKIKNGNIFNIKHLIFGPVIYDYMLKDMA